MTRHLLRDDPNRRAGEILALGGRPEEGPLEGSAAGWPADRRGDLRQSSTRTRVVCCRNRRSRRVAADHLDRQQSAGRQGDPADTARVLERQVAAIVWRTYAQAGLKRWLPARGCPSSMRSATTSIRVRSSPICSIQEAQGRAEGPHARLLRGRAHQHGAVLCSRGVTAGMCMCASPPRWSTHRVRTGRGRRRPPRRADRRFGRALHRPQRGRPPRTSSSPTPGSRWARRTKSSNGFDLTPCQGVAGTHEPRQGRRDLHPLPPADRGWWMPR